MTPTTRPRLLFFQWDHSPQRRYARYFAQHARDHVRCLEHHFEVAVVNEDCDYAEACDRHRPDLCLFELGYQSLLSHRIEVRNTRAHPQVPKVALLNADSWAWTRAGLLSDLDHLGIGTAFSIATTVRDYMPEMLDALFVWPNFVDPEVFRDYGAPKTVPVMLAGAQLPLYPWRQDVTPLLVQSYPSLVCPPHSYADASAARALHGESYARALNASLFAPSCGSMAGEVVRKHFEIPAAACCLITQRRPMVEAAGFVHMDNCVFAEADEILDIVDGLLADPERLGAITRRGHDLVHARHTLAHRPQILQWFLLQRDLPPGRRIVQRDPFAEIEAVDRGAPVVPMPKGGGLDRVLLHRAHASLGRGDVAGARESFAAALAYVADLPEGVLGMALCDLAEGQPDAAAERIARLIVATTVTYGARDPDPVEWAVYLHALLSLGREAEVRRLVDWYPRLSHPALDALRLRIGHAPGPPEGQPLRPSVHDSFVTPAGAWQFLTGGSAPSRRRSAGGPAALAGRLAAGLLALGPASWRPNLPPTRELDYLGNLRARLRRAFRRGPLGETAATLRRAVKDRRERRRLLGGAAARKRG